MRIDNHWVITSKGNHESHVVTCHENITADISALSSVAYG